MKIWKRNAVVVVIVLFVGAAVYLNWSYGQKSDVDASTSGKLLGEAALVSGKTEESAPPAETDAGENSTSSAQSSTGYFASARLNRQQARDSALEILQQAAADAMADQAVIDEANISIQTIADNIMAEAQIENLVTAKGYGDCVCYIDEDSASVVVAASEAGLTDTDTAKIAEIVKEETSFTINQIKIIEAEP